MFNKIYKGLFLFAVVLLIGTLGFFTAFDYSWLDAFYMTIITTTTVGFGEVRPLDDWGKIFTIVLLLMSVGVYGYLVTVISDFFSNNVLMEAFRIKKELKEIAKLEKHTIICGFGRNGRQSYEKLKKFKKTCVVIEQDDNFIENPIYEEIQFVKGDATNDDVLRNAGIEKAANLITALPSDANNLYVVLSARQINGKLNIVSRANDENATKKLKIAGADHVIMPDKLGGEHMASLLVTPDLVEFVNRINMEGDSNANLEEIGVDELPKEYMMKSIQDLDVRRNSGCNVIGFITEKDEYIVNPSSKMILKPHCKLIVLGRPEQIEKFKEVYE
ncbi:TrkA family potassium uptake protein [Wenyingzhuangia sp. 2_MG-2023]|uniref:potassium channel family protein n=1 Tax=Wenyingzhuangia sp. 2_MG-2023 TaxID=3062639 RepID=UPI0026E2449E|nr:potassium channel protein [Wenyingzhuangia sp. 2_MG-2023]MDO6737253.1 NAD-binding protein [Wenyingzhuangia sp. 2_MG-2023]